MARLAVLEKKSCRPKDCGHECRKYCPMVRSNLDAVTFGEPEGAPTISEAICSGCGICVKKCPFKAISVVNVAEELQAESFHRYGANGFKLFRFVSPQQGAVTGILGMNGTGKTTVMRILAGEVLPNLGNFEEPPSREEVLRFLRGSVSQTLLERVWSGKSRVVLKPQYVDRIPRAVRGTVGEVVERNDEGGSGRAIAGSLGLSEIWDRSVEVLSGGELQRLAIAVACSKQADFFLFDEPSSFLDVEQRLSVCKAIRGLCGEDRTVVVVEHDLAMLDYVCDYVSIIYGQPGTYGIVSETMSSRTGINTYLNGYIRSENVLFRDEPIVFRERPPPAPKEGQPLFSWEPGEVSLGGFTLTYSGGEVSEGEVVGIIGPNGIGKTTFVKLLAEKLAPSFFSRKRSRNLAISYKPQYVSELFTGRVGEILSEKPGSEVGAILSSLVRHLKLDRLLERDCESLSGGELQAVAIAYALSKEADLYFLDEPCAYLDVEQRMAVARATRRLTEARGVSTFVVEHDVVAIDFMSDGLVVFEGEPGKRGNATSRLDMRSGMNAFLSGRDVTFRRDADTRRPRINKPGSKADKAQKLIGEFYYGAEPEG
ncbi:MAG: ribosome biogenesis/translation initiation ATPase RLI [Candidatus Brockarchaeota archaeon]|nr:ribosome biogenesis/translation initiation ATPase RLI [Candidatus Brockarchaeota archaeon]